MWRLPVGWLVLWPLLLGCDPSQPISVDVHTDLVPGEEFDRIEVRSGDSFLTDPARTSGYLRGGVRIGPLPTAGGPIELTVSALSGERVVLERSLRLTVRGPVVVPVWLLRSCLGAVCPRDSDAPEATTCESGRCVVPDCVDLPDSDRTCLGPSCTDSTSCAAPLADCAVGQCLDGRCLVEPIADACRGDEYCSAEVGCVPRSMVLRTDAGPPRPPDAPPRDIPITVDAPTGCWLDESGGCTTPAIAVAAGANHTCFLLADQTVACAGDSNVNVVGVAPRGWVLTPVIVEGLPPASAIGVGYDTSCAVHVDGGLSCWGRNGAGQLGDGGTGGRFAPSAVRGLDGPVVLVEGGGVHTCALLASGAARCWGASSSWGQVCDGMLVNRTLPSPVAIAAELSHLSLSWVDTCMLDADGAAFCCGHNGSGNVGDGTRTTRPAPTAVVGLPGPVRSVAAGGYSDINHSCAVLVDGTVYCWGNGGAGRLGNGDNNSSLTPVQVTGLTDAVEVALGVAGGCALTEGREIWCWGDNALGELGNGTTTGSRVPVRVDVPPVSSFSVGTRHVCVITELGTPMCWGGRRRFGSGTTVNELVPVRVAVPTRD